VFILSRSLVLWYCMFYISSLLPLAKQMLTGRFADIQSTGGQSFSEWPVRGENAWRKRWKSFRMRHSEIRSRRTANGSL